MRGLVNGIGGTVMDDKPKPELPAFLLPPADAPGNIVKGDSFPSMGPIEHEPDGPIMRGGVVCLFVAAMAFGCFVMAAGLWARDQFMTPRKEQARFAVPVDQIVPKPVKTIRYQVETLAPIAAEAAAEPEPAPQPIAEKAKPAGKMTKKKRRARN